jgi:hypothetical protein
VVQDYKNKKMVVEELEMLLAIMAPVQPVALRIENPINKLRKW